MFLICDLIRRKFLVTPIAVVMSAALLPGCSKPKTIETYTVTGKISVDNKPASYAKLTFWPVGESNDYMLSTTADNDGNFELMARKPPEGADLVKYEVTVSWRIPANPASSNDPEYGPELLPIKFKSPKTSGIVVEVESEAVELKPINISPSSSDKDSSGDSNSRNR